MMFLSHTLKCILTTLMFISFTTLWSQNDFKDGFIIKNNGDSIYGMVDSRSSLSNALQCVFKDTTENIIVYQPFEINNYGFTDGQFFISKYLENGDSLNPIFAEYLVKGQKDLYRTKDYSGYKFLISRNDSVLIYVPFEKKIINSDIGLAEYKSTKHIGLLKVYFSDVSEVNSDIESIKEPTTKNMIQLTKKYNTIVCGDSGCIVYEKKLQKMKFGIGFNYGIAKSLYEDVSCPQYNFSLNFSLPSTNNRVTLQTGITYLTNDTIIEQPDGNLTIMIPIKFYYSLAVGEVVPQVGAGLYLYPFTFETNISGRVLFRLSNNIHLEIVADLDQRVFIRPMMLSFSGGLVFEF